MIAKFKKDRVFAKDPNVKIISYDQAPFEKQNQMCVQHKLKFEQKEGQAVSVKMASGYTCLHPTLQNAVLDVMYTTAADAKADVVKEGEDFVKGITIEVEPGKQAS